MIAGGHHLWRNHLLNVLHWMYDIRQEHEKLIIQSQQIWTSFRPKHSPKIWECTIFRKTGLGFFFIRSALWRRRTIIIMWVNKFNEWIKWADKFVSILYLPILLPTPVIPTVSSEEGTSGNFRPLICLFSFSEKIQFLINLPFPTPMSHISPLHPAAQVQPPLTGSHTPPFKHWQILVQPWPKYPTGQAVGKQGGREGMRKKEKERGRGRERKGERSGRQRERERVGRGRENSSGVSPVDCEIESKRKEG